MADEEDMDALPLRDGGGPGGGNDILKFVSKSSSETVELISNTKMKLLSGTLSFILDSPSAGIAWGWWWVLAVHLFVYAIALLVKTLSVLLSAPRFPRGSQLTLVIIAYLAQLAAEACQVLALVIALKLLLAGVSAGLASLFSARC